MTQKIIVKKCPIPDCGKSYGGFKRSIVKRRLEYHIKTKHRSYSRALKREKAGLTLPKRSRFRMTQLHEKIAYVCPIDSTRYATRAGLKGHLKRAVQTTIGLNAASHGQLLARWNEASKRKIPFIRRLEK